MSVSSSRFRSPSSLDTNIVVLNIIKRLCTIPDCEILTQRDVFCITDDFIGK